MNSFKKLFPKPCSVIAVIHVKALPGTPGYSEGMKSILDQAIHEAIIFKEAAVDGLIIENMHDLPYLNREVGHEISTAMSIVGWEVKKATGLPCGVQVLAGANKAALAVAKSAGLDFIRAEGFVFAHIGDEGSFDSDAGELLRYRKMIDAEDILIFTDIKKKHSSHAITGDIDIIETAKAASFFKSDGLIITGVATGTPPDLSELEAVKDSTLTPVLIGSGITLDNVSQYEPHSDAMIIGSWFKKNGFWANEIDLQRMKTWQNFRKKNMRK